MLIVMVNHINMRWWCWRWLIMMKDNNTQQLRWGADGDACWYEQRIMMPMTMMWRIITSYKSTDIAHSGLHTTYTCREKYVPASLLKDQHWNVLCSCLSVVDIIEIVAVIIMYIIVTFGVSFDICIMSGARLEELQVTGNRIDLGRTSKWHIIGELSVGRNWYGIAVTTTSRVGSNGVRRGRRYPAGSEEMMCWWCGILCLIEKLKG